MKRRLLNLLTALSLLLCVAVVVLWVDSYLPEQFHLRSHRGRILIVFAAKRHAPMFDPYGVFNLDLVVQNVRSDVAARGYAVPLWRLRGRAVGPG